MMEPELAALCVQSVNLYPPGPIDAYGQISYATTPIKAACHIVGKYLEVTDKHGQTAVSAGHAILTDIYPALNDNFMIEVPDLSSSTGYRAANIISVLTHYDENGPHHQSVYYGRPGGFTGGNTGAS